MPRLPKFKDYHISPLTGPMNSLTPLDLLNDKQFRYIKNFRVDGAGRLKRAGGFKALFDDGNYNVGGTIKNNSDLHDQLGSKQTPTNTVREPITLLFEFESGNGSRKLIAATKSRIYALNQRSRNWILIGDNGGSGYAMGTSASYSSIKFKAAQLGNNIVFTNNYDQPLNWFFDSKPDRADKNLAITIPDLVKLKITKAAHLSEYKGFMFLGDLEESSTQQVSKVQWSDYVDATSYYPSLASLAGQQTVGDIGERIIGMAVLGDHLMIYKERSIWRCSLVSSSNLFVFKQVYQGENTPFYEDTLINTGDAHFYMSEAGIYRMTLASLRPQRVDWMHNASAIIFEDVVISAEDGTGPRFVTGGIKNLDIEQEGTIAAVAACSSRPPQITAHPTNLTINANPCSASYTASTSLTVHATGREPFSYQWQEKLVSASTWSDISGEQSSVFKITNPSAPDHYNKQYRVGVNNADRTPAEGPVYSNAASVTLAGFSSVPSFIQHPSDVTASIGDDVTFEVRYCTSITASKWRKDSDGSGSGPTDISHNGTKYIVETGLVPPIGDASGYYFSKLTVKNVQLTDGNDDSNTYSFQATNPSGTTNSNTASIIIPTTTVTLESEGDDFYPVFSDDYVGRDFITRYASDGSRYYEETFSPGNMRGGDGDETYGESYYGHLSPKPFRSSVEKGVDGNDWGGTKHESHAVWYKPFKWLALGGTAPYSYEVYRCNDTEGIKTAEAKALPSNPNDIITLSVERTHMTLSVGDIIKFNASGGTAVFTLTQQAKFRSNTLTGKLTGAALQDDLVSIRHWNENDQPVTDFKDNTCDLTAHTVTGCNTSANTSAKTTTVTGFSNSNVAAGQIVTGTGVPSHTYVLASPAPTSSTCTLNRAVTSNESNTTLVFGTNEITCNSNKYIEVGQKVSGSGIPKGATVKTIDTDRAVTSFTISYPVSSSANNVELTFEPKLVKYHYAHVSKTKEDTDTVDLSFRVTGTTGGGSGSGFRYPVSTGWKCNGNTSDAIGKLQCHFNVGYESMFRVKVTDSSSSPVSSFSDYKWINRYPSSDL